MVLDGVQRGKERAPFTSLKMLGTTCLHLIGESVGSTEMTKRLQYRNELFRETVHYFFLQLSISNP